MCLILGIIVFLCSLFVLCTVFGTFMCYRECFLRNCLDLGGRYAIMPEHVREKKCFLGVFFSLGFIVFVFIV